jgi:two-component system cell cycle sensor histidine kinase/response regulator CckA
VFGFDSASVPIGVGSYTILVVEDDHDVRRALLRMVFQLGYKVLSASNGEQAIAMSQEYDYPIHLLLTDVILPDTRGPHLAEKLKRTRPALKVLYISGYAYEDLTITFPAMAKDAFLQKPFSASQLGARLRELLLPDVHELE